jgi:hypothetical protein
MLIAIPCQETALRRVLKNMLREARELAGIMLDSKTGVMLPRARSQPLVLQEIELEIELRLRHCGSHIDAVEDAGQWEFG